MEEMQERMDGPESDECFLFCDKHENEGVKRLKQGGKARLLQPSIMKGAKKQKMVTEFEEINLEEEDNEGDSDHNGGTNMKKGVVNRKNMMANANHVRNGFKKKGKSPKSLPHYVNPSMPSFSVELADCTNGPRKAMKTKKTGKAETSQDLSRGPVMYPTPNPSTAPSSQDPAPGGTATTNESRYYLD